MALTHVVDTSVLTRLGNPAVRDAIEPLASTGRLARSEISDLEVGFSARNAREWDRLMGALEVFTCLKLAGHHVIRAKQVQRLLAAKNQRGCKIPDLMIAATAEERGLILLHYDRDYDRIAAVTGQACSWVVRKGSID